MLGATAARNKSRGKQLQGMKNPALELANESVANVRELYLIAFFYIGYSTYTIINLRPSTNIKAVTNDAVSNRLSF